MMPSTIQPPLPSDTSVLDAILAALKEGHSFCLSGHQNPDPDVVGSQIALASLIKRLGAQKQVDILNSGQPPHSLAFLSGFKHVQNVEKVSGRYDVIVVFECSGQDRMGNIIDLGTQGTVVINLDHHLHNPNFGHINFVEPATSSTAELVFKIFEHSGLALNQQEAMALYTGLVADTGWFRYGNSNPQTHRIASALLAAGVPVAEIAERMYMSQSLPAMRLLGWVLTHLRLIHNDRVAVLTLPTDVYREVGAGPDDVNEVVNFGLKIESVCASIFLKEKKEEGVVKVSLRSKEKYNVNQVAVLFGGGGHKNASGCTIKGTIESAENEILKEVIRVI